jgi:hypothetical protein
LQGPCHHKSPGFLGAAGFDPPQFATAWLFSCLKIKQRKGLAIKSLAKENKGLHGGTMNWAVTLLLVAFFGALIVWPLSYFGYRFYIELTQPEDSGHH